MTLLSSVAGIDIEWAIDGTLSFAPDLVVDETLSRPRERLRPVALDPEACVPAEQIQYWMYNGVARQMDRDRLAATGMRYELTLMFPHPLGRERAKTLGHLHNAPPASRLNYPEICEVVYGSAFFVFQTIDSAARGAPFCAVLEAHAGDKVIIPPNLHHLTINAGDGPLLFSDVIPLATKGIYEPLMDMRGAAYLRTVEDGWLPNPAYRFVPQLVQWPARAYPELHLTPDRPLYTTFAENPELLDWMLEPDRFSQSFPDLWRGIEAAIAA